MVGRRIGVAATAKSISYSLNCFEHACIIIEPQPHLEISHSCLVAVPKARTATTNRQVCQHTIPLLTSFHRYCTNQCILSGFIKPIFVPSAIGCCAGQEGCYAVQM